MNGDHDRFEIDTLIGHRRRDGTLDAVAVTITVRDDSEVSRLRVHYDVADGDARLDHFVVGDESAVFAVEELQCVPLAEQAITAVPGVENVEPGEQTVARAMGRTPGSDEG